MNDEPPVLDQVNLVVSDMAATVDFYRLLGLDVAAAEPPWDRHHRTASSPPGLDMDLDSSAFAAVWDQGWLAGRTGAVIGFRVSSRDAVDQLYERLTAAGHGAEQPPYDAFWGARYAIVADPDGNAVGIMSPADPDRRSAPTPPPESPERS
jgi:catechol 2,3-dioxygenase-like lactoylglutathione lyase family enzyme